MKKTALIALLIISVFSLSHDRSSFACPVGMKLSNGASTQTVSLLTDCPDNIALQTQKKQIRIANGITTFLNKKKEHKKITAIVLAVALGPFGAHRLYLGTATKVPVVYCLTLGGGLGILPLTDIIAIIATKDIGRYEHNTKVVMWINAVE